MNSGPHILVVGGAGYIGSHMVKLLGESGYRVTTFDNLSLGHRESVQHGELVIGDILSSSDLRTLFESNKFDAVMHFAAFAYVRESVEHPRKYYRNNVTGTENLLAAMLDANINRLVFSSSCATFGEVPTGHITETTPQAPINPYGYTKLIVEQILKDYAAAYGLSSVSLRYFNAAGAHPSGELRELHDPEPHIVPLILREADRVKRGGDPTHSTLKIFGTDFPTPDGTCVRDYVHVQDLCSAHLLALRGLLDDTATGAEAYNLGNAQGFSVKQVIDAASEVTGVPIQYGTTGRKAGDPARLVADSSRAKTALGWQPEYTDLKDILRTAWHASYPEHTAT